MRKWAAPLAAAALFTAAPCRAQVQVAALRVCVAPVAGSGSAGGLAPLKRAGLKPSLLKGGLGGTPVPLSLLPTVRSVNAVTVRPRRMSAKVAVAPAGAPVVDHAVAPRAALSVFKAKKHAGRSVSVKAVSGAGKRYVPVTKNLRAALKGLAGKPDSSPDPVRLRTAFDGSGAEVSLRGAKGADAAPVRGRNGPLRLLISGPPGSGKSTQARKLAKELGVVHITAGGLLREYAKDRPRVKARMNSGKLVDTALVLRLVRERLAADDVKRRGFILDGFPRRMVEAAELDGIIGEGNAIDGMINLRVPERELLRRIKLRGRADDSEAVFRERMEVYREQTVPVIAEFSRKLPVVEPRSAAGPVESVYREILAGLRRLLPD